MTKLIQLIYWRILFRFFSALPIAVNEAFAAAIGRFKALTSPGARVVIEEELAKCSLAGRGRNGEVTYRAMKNRVSSQIKLCYLRKLNPDNVNDLLPVQGLPVLNEALRQGKGCIALNPHFGPFMLIMPALGYRNFKVSQVALQNEPIIGKRLGLERQIYRAKFAAIEGNMPISFINAADGPMALRDVLRGLEQNRIILFASTGRGGKAWHTARFLGRQASFSLTPFRISAKSGAPLVPVFVIDAKPLARIVIEKPIVIEPGGSPETMLETYIAVLEKFVKEYPDHFALYLRDMRIHSWWDDHPFFSDYPKKTGLEVAAS